MQGYIICSCGTSSTNKTLIENQSMTTTVDNLTSGKTETHENSQNSTFKKSREDSKQQAIKANDEEFNIAQAVKQENLPKLETGNHVFLKCSLEVWHSVNYDPSSLDHVLCNLLESATRLSEERWLVYPV